MPPDIQAKPVKADEILSYPKEWQTEFSVSYTNILKKSAMEAPVLIEQPNGTFIIIPSLIGEEKVNEDFISYSSGLRYGITRRLEVSSFINLHSSFQRMMLADQNKSKRDHRFDVLNLGISYQLIKEDQYPALFCLFSVNLIDNQRFDTSYKQNYLKTYLLSLLSCYIVDPVVFLLQTKYQLNLKRQKGDDFIDLGEVFSLSPGIYFAVNPYTTLNWGVNLNWQGKTRVKG
ncbi:hypothetical protein HY793_01850, partial [Candidatus Desantisbacteria bacterium]|nr:hypothetical protein [Candidatus Desantisbacteria bacterium]